MVTPKTFYYQHPTMEPGAAALSQALGGLAEPRCHFRHPAVYLPQLGIAAESKVSIPCFTCSKLRDIKSRESTSTLTQLKKKKKKET